MPVKVLASEWICCLRLHPHFKRGGSERRCRARSSIRGGQRREGHQLSLAAPVLPIARQTRISPTVLPSSRRPCDMRSGKGCFITIAGGNEFEANVPPFGLNPTSVLAETRVAHSRRRVRSPPSIAEEPRLLFEHRQLHRCSRSGGRHAAIGVAGPSSSRHSTARSPTRSCWRPSQYHAPRSTSWPTCPFKGRRWPRPTSPRGGDADAAGRHRSGRD